MADQTRAAYRELSDDEKFRIQAIKATGEALLELCDFNGREAAIAKTKVEEAVMWAVKGVTG